MAVKAPHGAIIQCPGSKNKLSHTPLTSPGLFHEIHCDGHEKLGHLALHIGGVGIPIYGMREKCTGRYIRLVVVLNDCLAVVIGHVYLDMVEEYGYV